MINNNLRNSIIEKFHQFSNDACVAVQKISIDQNLKHALSVATIYNLALIVITYKCTTFFYSILGKKWLPSVCGSTAIAVINYVFFNKVKTAIPEKLQIALTATSVGIYYLLQYRNSLEMIQDDEEIDTDILNDYTEMNSTKVDQKSS